MIILSRASVCLPILMAAAPWQRLIAMSVALQELQQSNEATRRAFVARYEGHLFPSLGTSVAQTRWWTYHNITRVTLWGHDHFKNNVRLFMVMEALDLGPSYYYVIRSFCPSFFDRLFLLVQFLPHRKMYLHSIYGLPLGGPFNNSPRLIQIGRDIYQRRIPQAESPMYCPACNDRYCDHAMDGLNII